jgi:hypothetical protein
MSRPVAVALIAMSCLWAMSAPAAAQDLVVDPPALFAKMTAPAGGDWQAPGRVSPATRGLVLPSLYVSLIGLQVYDGYSTSRGLANGAIEGNTFMSGVASHPAMLWAAKGGAAFASIYVAERLWRQGHRGQAIAMMVASNGLMVAVAASNASVIHAQR